MKKYILLLLTAITTLSSCENREGYPDYPIVDPYLNLDWHYPDLECKSDGSVVPPPGAKKNETPFYNNHYGCWMWYYKVTWQFTGLPSWINVANSSGGSRDNRYSDYIGFFASPNPTRAERTCSFTINSTTKGYAFSKTFFVKQSGEPYVNVLSLATEADEYASYMQECNMGNYDFWFKCETYLHYLDYDYTDGSCIYGKYYYYDEDIPWEGGTIKVKVQSNAIDDVEISFPLSDIEPSWDFNKSESTITITFPPKSSQSGHTMLLHIKGESAETNVGVKFYYK